MKNIIFNRPVISILFVYIFVLVFLNYLGIFLPQRNSFLINNTDKYTTELTGKVITEPIQKGEKQQFILEVFDTDGQKIKKEKTLVYASSAYNIEYGDIIFVSGKLNIPEKPVFPYIFNYNLYLQRENIYTIFYQQNFEFIEKQPNKIKQLSFKVRNNIETKIDNFFNEPVSSVLKSMVTGNKALLDKDIKEDFVNTGLIHILVISGLHIGFCAAIFMFCFRLFGLKLNYVYLLTIPTLFFYVLLTGANPPAIRAAIMFSCLLVTLMLNREPLIYNALALSALIILIFNPQSLFTASFQLSFLATLGILYLYPKFSKCFGIIKNKYINFVWDIVCVTLSAQIALIPLLVFYFGKISVISFVLNLIIVPIIPIIIGLFFVFYVSTFLSYHISLSVSLLLSYILKFILYVINYSATLDYSVVFFAVPGIVMILFYYFSVYIMFEIKNKKVLGLLFVIICFMLLNPFEQRTFAKTFEGKKNITTHIKEKGNKNIIIFKELQKDKYYFNNLEQYLLAQGIKEIDVMYTDYDKKYVDDNLKKIKAVNVLKNTLETHS
ncbi:ComEC/Rec2 family competence protein [Candidatus Ruminimicrobiellum ovillum]|uniref:ComEC/Rec2 family competence protein n=1 Tax=Candidatus Ruminimicrobiellum ovillum TaxID=1947927 RepID=UPI00355A3BD6